MIRLEDIRCFVEAVDCGGLNRAAARLGLSKSIVSRRIAAMEADLGVQLLTRTTRGIVPTEAGQDFRLRCERILADLAEARDAVAAKGGDLTGRLRITAPMVLGREIVGPILGDLARQYPRLRIDAVFTDRLVDLVGEGFDLGIRIGEPRGSSLIGRKIAPIRVALIASPGYLAQAGTPQTPADLSDHKCLSYSGGGDWRFRVGGRWLSIRPMGRLRTDSGETIVQWAAAGLGIGNVPAYLANAALKSGALVKLLPEFPQPEFGVHALRPPGARAPARVALLIDALVEQLKSCKELRD
jgi:DNA-binding transcriptional LysR family regulator